MVVYFRFLLYTLFTANVVMSESVLYSKPRFELLLNVYLILNVFANNIKYFFFEH